MTEEADSSLRNAVHPDTIKRFVGEAIRKLDDLESERGVYMSRCKGIREQLTEVKDRAKDAGISRKAFNATLKRIAIEKQLEGIVDDLEDDDSDLFEYMTEVLGDFVTTPLGEAAAKAVASKPANDDAPTTGRAKRAKARSAAADSLTDDEADAVAAEANAAALAGLKQLPN